MGDSWNLLAYDPRTKLNVERAIFISYRREDTIAHAGRLADRLSAHFGKDSVFIDVDGISPGEDFIDVLTSKVAACDTLIAVIGKHWLDATDEHARPRLENPEDFVLVEIRAALQRKIRVIPVLVGGAEMPRPLELPESIRALARRNAFSISDTGFHISVSRLIEALERTTVMPSLRTEDSSPEESSRGASAFESTRIDDISQQAAESPISISEILTTASSPFASNDERARTESTTATSASTLADLESGEGDSERLFARPENDRYVQVEEPDRWRRQLTVGVPVLGMSILAVLYLSISTSPRKEGGDVDQTTATERSSVVTQTGPPRNTAGVSTTPQQEKPTSATQTLRPAVQTVTSRPSDKINTPVRVGGDIKPPTKTKDVRPSYPPIAQASRVQGVVIIEATIGSDGKVQDARVLRSIPLLDAAAVEAVRQWEFTPTLLKGVAIPVIMTVSVQFNLSDSNSDTTAAAASVQPKEPGEAVAPRDRSKFFLADDHKNADAAITARGNSVALYNQGAVLYNAGKFAEAKTRFEAATKADPSNAIAFYQLGMTMINLGQHSDAVTALQTFLKLAPGDPKAEEVRATLPVLQQGSPR